MATRILEKRAKSIGIETGNPFSLFQEKYKNDPAGFALDCIEWKEGQGPTDYQSEIMNILVDNKRLSVRGPHGLGKTGMVAWIILWFALTRDGWTDWKIPMTASAWRQLTHFLCPEIHKWSRSLRWEIIGREPFNTRTELLQLNLKLTTGEAFALASDNSTMIEGAHASDMLYIFDESKEIPVATWDSAEGAFSAGNCLWLSVSTPGEPVGRFYDIQSHSTGYDDWKVRAVTLQEAIDAGRVNKEWAESRRKQWGENSAVYINRVKGDFASSEENGVIPLSWIEAANTRWYEWKDTQPELAFRCVGVDVARSGEDKTCMALRWGDVITEIRETSKEDTMQTTGRVVGILDAYGGKAVVDVIGIGAGVVDRLRELKKNVKPFNASEHTDHKDKSGELGFANKRAASYWNLRELLDPSSEPTIALPPIDILTGDLISPHWDIQSGGKIVIESKDDIKERIGRSTDYSDAVVMAFFDDMRPSLKNWVDALNKRNEAKNGNT